MKPDPTQPPTRAHLYIRVSTSKQEISPEAQETNLREHCTRKGYEVAAVYVDRKSGSLPVRLRPGLREAIGALQEGDVLLYWRQDRLSRDLYGFVNIERMVTSERRARLESATQDGINGDNPQAVLFRNMLAAFDQYEKDIISIRTSAALQELKRKGRHVGRPSIFAGKGKRGRQGKIDGAWERFQELCAEHNYLAGPVHEHMNRGGFSVSLPTVRKYARLLQGERQ